ncbi:TetR/AcrR family transcriptional regulator [Candidatus Accumulibacter sp. ACC003]|uniref:TetR/AcrR family transcriptional regulator n=1 Tax=Candidatus Accumulibacter sp. ACC003 TaxID=2823334 RepID=UPI0025C6DCD0|nr:TetR/AcrR family transcriptional regulator [Candidatus Accumulibacter sp. ACC003]
MPLEPIPDTPRRERKRQQTADRLVQTAFALFAEHGYAAVTMEQIAAAADVAKGTLYNYFPVKEALVRHRMHADLAAHLPVLLKAVPDGAGCAERLRAFLHASADYLQGAREYLPAYLQYRLGQPIADMQGATRSGLDQVFVDLIDAGQAGGEIASHLKAEELASHLQFLHLGALLHWLAQPETDLRVAFDWMLDMFFHGCAAGTAS